MEILRSQNNVNFGKRGPSQIREIPKLLSTSNKDLNLPQAFEWITRQASSLKNHQKISRDVLDLQDKAHAILLERPKAPMQTVNGFVGSINKLIQKAYYGIKHK